MAEKALRKELRKELWKELGTICGKKKQPKKVEKKKRKESPTESILEEMSVVPFSKILKEISRREYQQHDLRKVSTMDLLYELHDRSVKLKEVIEYQRHYPEPHYDLRKVVRSDLDNELYARDPMSFLYAVG